LELATKVKDEPAAKKTTAKGKKAAVPKTKETPPSKSKKTTKATTPVGLELNMDLPPLFKRSLNTGHITEADEAELIKSSKRSTKTERARLVEIIKAVHGKTPVDENLINQILTGK